MQKHRRCYGYDLNSTDHRNDASSNNSQSAGVCQLQHQQESTMMYHRRTVRRHPEH